VEDSVEIASRGERDKPGPHNRGKKFGDAVCVGWDVELVAC
jgi:hypothetical protein